MPKNIPRNNSPENRIPAAASRGDGKRCLMVGEAVRRSLAALFQRSDWQNGELGRERLTFTEVKMSADLGWAKVYFTAARPDEATALLTASAAEIRHRLAPMLKLQKLPNLDFHYDETIDKAQAVNSLFSSPHVRRDL